MINLYSEIAAKLEEMWPKLKSMMENFVTFFSENVVVDPSTFDVNAYAEKLVAMALTDTATKEQFVGVYNVRTITKILV